MEVAMPVARRLARGVFSLLAIAAIVVITGCTELVDYSDRSRSQGLALYQEKAYTDAAGAFRNAIRQAPNDYESHFYLGACYDALNQHPLAFRQYRTALEIMNRFVNTAADPRFYELRQIALDTLGASVAKYDRNDVELNSLEARAKTTQNADDWFVVAKVYRVRGDADRAMDAYRRAAKWDSDNFHVRKEYGLYLLTTLNQRREAEYYLRQAYRLKPTDYEVATALEKLGVVMTPPVPGDPAVPARGPLPGGSVAAPRD
jgi:Tfp pilus assembly protein PilF